MASPSYLRQIAARGTTDPGRTTIAPQRIMFRPIPVHGALPLEAETEIAPPPRSSIAGHPPEPAIEPALPPRFGAGSHLPLAAARRELRDPEEAAPRLPGIMQQPAPASVEQSMSSDPVPREVPGGQPASAAVPAGPMRPRAAARDPAPAPPSVPRGEETGPKPLPQTTGSGQFAERAGPPIHKAGRDPRPAFAVEQLAAQTPRSLVPPGDRRRLNDSEAPSAAAESIPALDERIQLTPPLNHGPRVIDGATATRAARATTEGGVHIGSLEVHVAAPPVAAAPPTPAPAPLPGTRNGRAIAPLARGFPGFGLVHS
jgi:hypothetical protein